ncbi:MAG: PilT/PilU family type 4a pilus ATPase [Patescibacteria group bacterium]
MEENTNNNSGTYFDALEIPHLINDKSEVYSLIELAMSRGASDLHLSMGMYPFIRVEGKLFPLTERPRLTPGYIEKLIYFLITEEQQQILRDTKELDFSYIFKDQAFLRANAFYQKNSLSCVIRLIPAHVKPRESLHLPESINQFAKLHHGLVLVTGPSGSGKSTTLATMIEEINRTRVAHILTIEDPIEYVFSPRQSIINQREVRHDTLSFKNALRSSLREDFDVIMIGELRDLESIEAALTIAEAGHLVFATMHAGSAAQAPDRIVNIFPPYYQTQIRNQLSQVLAGVVAQRLLPSVAGGLIPVTEIVIANNAVRNLIREDKTNQIKTVMETSRSEGMITFEQTLTTMLEEGKITEQTVKTMM